MPSLSLALFSLSLSLSLSKFISWVIFVLYHFCERHQHNYKLLSAKSSIVCLISSVQNDEKTFRLCTAVVYMPSVLQKMTKYVVECTCFDLSKTKEWMHPLFGDALPFSSNHTDLINPSHSRSQSYSRPRCGSLT